MYSKKSSYAGAEIRKEGYRVTAIINETQSLVQSCQCEDCATSEGGCKHAAALLLWLHRRSEEPSITSITCYWKKTKLSICTSRKSFIKAIQCFL
ncbi:hypothetical protein SFRURICE_003177 [Spodoptera frugiperda]|nr:hypothetical protein SFRURICE_003177 [Spodoptera frugiperda]